MMLNKKLQKKASTIIKKASTDFFNILFSDYPLKNASGLKKSFVTFLCSADDVKTQK